MPCPTIAKRNLISQKVVHKADCPSKYYTFGHQIQVCCALVCSNERSTASCSKSIMNSSKITQRKFDFPKVVHIQYCPSKYFTCSHLSQVCCALICSNERSIASCSWSIKNSSNRPKKFWFPKVVHIHYCPSKYFTCSHPSQVCCALIYMFQRKIYSVLLKVYHELFENRPKKFWFPKSCPQSRLSEQILWIPPPKSSMLCFDIFKWKINSVLRKGYHSVSPNRP